MAEYSSLQNIYFPYNTPMKVHIIKEDVGYSASIPEIGVFSQGDTWEAMMEDLTSGIELTDQYMKNKTPLLKKEFELVF